MLLRRCLTAAALAGLLASCGGDTAGPAHDFTKPTVAITGPAAGPVSDTVVITVTATDNDRVALVEFLINGGLLANSDSTAPYTYTWDTTKYPVGAYDWQAVAIDPSGNTDTSAAVRYTVSR